MKKCILHIGCEKTASTSIQHAIYDNNKALERRGFFSSWRMGYPNNRIFVAFFEPDFKEGLDDHHNEWTKLNGINSQADKDKYFENFEEDFHKEISLNAKHKHTCIISSEHFQGRVEDIQDIRKVRDVLYKSFEEVEVICYFREQYDRVIASWSTVIKVGWYASLEHYIATNCDLDNYAYDPMAMADRWSEVFGRKNCKFFLYDPEIDTVDHFFSAIDIDIDQCITETYQTLETQGKYVRNRSFYRLEAEAIRMVNKKKHTLHGPGGSVENVQANQKARKLIRTSPLFKYGAIKSDKKYEIRDMFRARNEKFFLKYFPTVYVFPTKKCIIPDPTPEQYAAAYEEFLEKVLFTKTLDNIDNINVNLLRDSAYKLRTTHPGQAMQLLRHAIEFRPSGENLLKTLEQWEQEDNIGK
jgi:hypothetical protein